MWWKATIPPQNPSNQTPCEGRRGWSTRLTWSGVTPDLLRPQSLSALGHSLSHLTPSALGKSVFQLGGGGVREKALIDRIINQLL